MPIATVPSHQAAIAIRAVNVLSTLLVNLTDEGGLATEAHGQPYHVTMTSLYTTERTVFPTVQVDVQLGKRVNGIGMQRLDTDSNGQPIYGYVAADSTILLHIHALSDAERHYLLDVLASGIEAGVYIDPVTNAVWDGAIKTWLAETGIVVKGLGPPTNPSVVSTDPQPEGQRFDAMLPILCDIFVSWTGGTQPLAPGITSTIYNTLDNVALQTSITMTFTP